MQSERFHIMLKFGSVGDSEGRNRRLEGKTTPTCKPGVCHGLEGVPLSLQLSWDFTDRISLVFSCHREKSLCCRAASCIAPGNLAMARAQPPPLLPGSTKVSMSSSDTGRPSLVALSPQALRVTHRPHPEHCQERGLTEGAEDALQRPPGSALARAFWR